MSDSAEKKADVSFLTALICGGLAGTSVDVALFPIDTLKTRLQSPQGFLKAGGFHGIYDGLAAAAAGSAPGAALFFSTYEVSKLDNKNFPFLRCTSNIFCLIFQDVKASFVIILTSVLLCSVPKMIYCLTMTICHYHIYIYICIEFETDFCIATTTLQCQSRTGGHCTHVSS